MSQRLSLSRAARLVGVKRGTLQKQIRSGELASFDGEIEVTGLLKLYPNAQLEDSTMLERVEQIMENAVCKTAEPDQKRTLVSALAARVAYLGRDLGHTRHTLTAYESLHQALQERLKTADRSDADELSGLLEWFQSEASALRSATEPCADEGFILNDTLMTFTSSHIRLLPSGHDFFVEGAESILDAGLKSGLGVHYGCNNGSCGKCKARVISGEVKTIRPHDYPLSDAEKQQRFILTCCHTALTDVVLDAQETDDASAIPHQIINAKIKKISFPDESIMALRLRTPRTERFRALGGQMAKLSVATEEPASLHIASCPCDENNMEFHIHQQHHPALWEALSTAKPQQKVQIEGPYGECVLRAESLRSCVFIAFGSGFAAIKSLIEHAMALDKAEQLHLLWFANEKDGGIYLRNLCRSWNDALDNVHFQAIETPGEGYPPLIPSLQHFLQTHEDHRELNYYIIGDNTEVDTTRNVLINASIPTRQVITQ